MNDVALAPHRYRQGKALHGQGKLADAITEYEAALALDAGHFDSLHYLGLALHQTGKTQAGLEHLKRALEINPQDLGALTNCGELCRSVGMALEAEVHLGLAVALYPGAVEPRVNLAALYLNQGRRQEAREALRHAREVTPEGTGLMRRLWALAHGPDEMVSQSPDRGEVFWITGRELNRRKRWSLALPFLKAAVDLKPTDPVRWLSLGLAHYDRDDKPAAIAAFSEAAKLDPGLAVAHTNLGNAYMEMGNEAAAERAYAEAARLAVDEPLARFNQALLQLKRGEWPQAWTLYDYRHGLPSARKLPGPRWNGEPLAGKRLLVHCEQGVGDTLQFLRFLEPLRRTGAHVTLAVQNSLSRLCCKVEGADDFLLDGRLPDFDVRIELLSLPRFLSTTRETLPPPTRGLAVPANHPVARRVSSLHGLKVGLCWSGAPGHVNDWRRSAPLGLLAPLTDVTGVQFVSLQVGRRGADIAAATLDGRIADWTSELKDFADTAAVIQALDIVITVDTAVAHLAATLGKPTWIMLANPGEWRWGDEPETSIWYPSVRLFRLAEPFAWMECTARVRDALVAHRGR